MQQPMNNVYKEIQQEYEKEDYIWYGKEYEPLYFTAIISEATGYVSGSVTDALEEASHYFQFTKADYDLYRNNLLYLGTLVIRAIESLDKGNYKDV